MRVSLAFPVLLLSSALLIAAMACGSSSNGDAEEAAAVAATAEAIAAASGFLTSVSAEEHVGEEVTVRGVVADYQRITGRSGRPTLLLFDVGGGVQAGSLVSNQLTPDTFSVLIWRVDTKNFPANLGVFYTGKTLCVTGTIEIWDDKTIINATDQSQIEIC